MSESQLDIANLGTQSLEGADYEDASEFFRPPDPGKEIIILKDLPKEEDFYPVKDYETQTVIPGFSFKGHFLIQGGKQDGKEFYAFLNTQKKLHRNGNDVQDYVRAMIASGAAIPAPQTLLDLKEAVQMYTAPVMAQLTWTGRPEGGGKTYKLKDFTRKADGTYNHVLNIDGESIGAQIKISAVFSVKKEDAA